ncbi:maleylacetate reductase [Nocardioides aestuarii]|uniref:Maleylacetate reductase n=1 Tax=Nocardioides aestuarii TaxID=252231 RepID=A0ABW4TSJ9_9ACTN
MTTGFEHETLGQRVRFTRDGAAEGVAAEVSHLGAERVMVIASGAGEALAARVTADIPVVLVHDDVVMHVPVEVADRAREAAESSGADALVCLGGGSTTGLAKAVALTTGLPIVAVPTTYAGSEATNVWGLTEDAVKTTGVDARVLPRAIVYDASLTTSLPVDLSVASGLNALAHCVDSMWAPRSDPIDRALAEEGIRALGGALPRVVDAPGDLAGRERMLYGAYLAAVAFSSAGSGLHHKICHVLGGRYGLPHAQTHAVVLPHVLALNAPRSPEAEARISRALGSDSALAGLQELRDRIDAPTSLRDFGLREEQLADAASAVLPAVPPSNPVTLSTDDLERLLRRAWEGADPR